jgi:transposase
LLAFSFSAFLLIIKKGKIMFLRLKKTKSGQALQLVHNYRDNSNKVRQKVIVSLGNADIPEDIRKDVAEAVEMKLSGEESLFPLSADTAKWTDYIIERIENENRWQSMHYSEEIKESEEVADGVLVDRIEHENATDLGALLVLKKAWNELGMKNILSASGFSSRQINTAMVSIFNRMIEPVSENELPSWCRTMSFNDLLKENVNGYSKDSYYRVSDLLLKHSSSIQKHLRETEENIFSLDRSIILYDLTNTYFEGKSERNPKSARGHSKEKRNDCPLLSLGLAVDSAGFIISYKIFEGNRHDASTLADMVKQLDRDLSGAGGRRVVVVDGGIATKENLDYLNKNGYEYIVAGKRQSRGAFYEDFCDDNAFSVISGRDGKKEVEVKRMNVNGENIVLCRSSQRKAKEDAILSRYEEKYIKALNKLNERLNKPKSHLKSVEKVQRAIGKINAEYTRASKFYDISYNEEDRLVYWTRKEDEYEKAQQMNGCYFLRSSLEFLSPEEIWKCYISLTKVEHAFKMMKTFLGIRPVRHHREDRCDGHLFITVLAYHLMCYIEQKMKEAGKASTWWNIKRILETHCYVTVIIPSKDGTVRTLRKPGRPDERQRGIYDVFKINCKELPVYKEIFQKM